MTQHSWHLLSKLMQAVGGGGRGLDGQMVMPGTLYAQSMSHTHSPTHPHPANFPFKSSFNESALTVTGSRLANSKPVSPTWSFEWSCQEGRGLDAGLQGLASLYQN